MGSRFIIGLPDRNLYELIISNTEGGGVHFEVKEGESAVFTSDFYRMQLIMLRRPQQFGGGSFTVLGLFDGPLNVRCLNVSGQWDK